MKFKCPRCKVLLGSSHAHSFSNVYGYICVMKTKLNGVHRDHMTCKAENICHLAFHRKGLLTPALYNSDHKSESNFMVMMNVIRCFIPGREKAISYLKHIHFFQKNRNFLHETLQIC